MLLLWSGYLFFWTFVLIFASRVSVDMFKRLMVRTGWHSLAIAAVAVAMFTTLPELLVAVTSSIRGIGEVSLGNVLGSNIFNISFIVGIAALASGSVGVVGGFIRWEMSAALVAGLMPLVLMLDGSLSRVDGVMLLLAYLLYVRDNLALNKHTKLIKQGKYQHTFLRTIRTRHEGRIDRMLVKMALMLLLMLFSANQVVVGAVALAGVLGLSIVFVSLVVVAVGTSLPELVLAIEAIRQKQAALVFGDLLGSVVTNSTWIIGITALIRPVMVVPVWRYSVFSLGFVVTFVLFWLFVSTKKRLDRWEGVVLIGVYLMLVGLEMLTS